MTGFFRTVTKAQTLGSLHCICKTQIYRLLRTQCQGTLPGEYISPGVDSGALGMAGGISDQQSHGAWESQNSYQGTTSQNHPQLYRRASGRCLPYIPKALLCEGHWGELEGTQPSLTYRVSKKPMLRSHLSASLTSAWTGTLNALRW